MLSQKHTIILLTVLITLATFILVNHVNINNNINNSITNADVDVDNNLQV